MRLSQVSSIRAHPDGLSGPSKLVRPEACKSFSALPETGTAWGVQKPWQRWATPELAHASGNVAMDRVDLGDSNSYLHGLRRTMEGWSWSSIQDKPLLEHLEKIEVSTRGQKIPDQTLRPLLHLYGALAERDQRGEPGLSKREEPEVRRAMIEGVRQKLEGWLAEGRFQVVGQEPVDLLALAQSEAPIRNGVIDASPQTPELSPAAADLLDRLESFSLSGGSKALEELRGQPEIAASLLGEVVTVVSADPRERDIEKIAKVLEFADRDPGIKQAMLPHQQKLFGVFEQLEARSRHLSRDGYVSGRYGQALLKFFPEASEEFVATTLPRWLDSDAEPRRTAAYSWCRALAHQPEQVGALVELSKNSRHYDGYKALEAVSEAGGSFSPEDLTWMAQRLADPEGPQPDDRGAGNFFFNTLIKSDTQALTQAQFEGRPAFEAITDKLLDSSALSYEVLVRNQGPLLDLFEQQPSSKTLLSWVERAAGSGKISDDEKDWKALALLLRRGLIGEELISTLAPLMETKFPGGYLGKDLSKVRLAFLSNPPEGTPARSLVRAAQLDTDPAAEGHLQELARRDWPVHELEGKVAADLEQHGKLTEASLAEAEMLWRRGREELLDRLIPCLPELTDQKQIGEHRLDDAVRHRYDEQLQARMNQDDSLASLLATSQEWDQKVSLWDRREGWTEQLESRFGQLGAEQTVALLNRHERYGKPSIVRFLRANNMGAERLDASAELLSFALDKIQDGGEASKTYQAWLGQIKEGATPYQVKEEFLMQQAGFSPDQREAYLRSEFGLEAGPELDFELEEDAVVIGDFALNRG